MSTSKNIHSSPIEIILWKPALDIAVAQSDELRSLLSSENNVLGAFWFPDGSVAVKRTEAAEEVLLWLGCLELQNNRTMFWKNTLFRSPLPAHYRRYQIISPIEYFERTGEMGPVVAPTPLCPERDVDMQKLTVRVQFAKILKSMQVGCFTRKLQQFQELLRKDEIFKPAFLTLELSSLVFKSKQAEFAIGAVNSRQDIINWLTLTILNFGYEVFPVVDISYGE